MHMENQNNIDNKPIDLQVIVAKIWAERRLFFIWLPTVLVATYLFLVCIPRYYTSKVSIAPESTSSVSSALGNFGSLAASFGLGSLSNIGNDDAIYSEIYPDLIGSKDFLARLMPVEVTTKDGKVTTNYYTYLKDVQKQAWWSTAIEWCINLVLPEKPDTYDGNGVMPVFKLTKPQYRILKDAGNSIECDVDRKTDIITIEVTDNDPLVAATIANATCQQLQQFIVDYRTNKARIDYDYYKELAAKSKLDYEAAAEAYARYADSHANVQLLAYKTKMDALENDMEQRFNLYTALLGEQQAAERKLQEATPAFTIIENASVPVKPAGPRRLLLSLAMSVLAFFILSAKVLRRKI